MHGSRRIWFPVWGLAVAVAVVWCGSAAAQPLVSLRFTSVDTVLGDAARVARAAGRPFDGPSLLAQALAAVGVSDPSAVDRQRPLLASLPVEGMLLQQRGIVVAVPVRSAEAMLDGMAASYPVRGRDGALHVFSDDSGPVLYAAEKGAYLVAGQTRDFVRRFDVGPVTRAWDGPPGNVQLEMFLEPLLPLLQAGLVSAREHLKQEIQSQVDQPSSAPSEQPPAGSDTVGGMVDLYLDAVQGILMDLSRLQVSLEVSGDHAFYHQRAVPRPGSATAAFVAAQQGALPAFGRVVQAGALNLAGHVNITPPLEAELQAFTSRYVRLTRQLLSDLQQASPPDSGDRDDLELLAAYLANSEQLLADGLRCFSGDAVASVDLSSPGGVGISQAVGTRERPGCPETVERTVEQLAALGAGKDGDPASAVEMTEVAGTPARRFVTDMSRYLEAADAEERRALERLYGGVRVENYLALAGGVMYHTSGKAARQRLEAMLGRRAGSGAAQDGITAAAFAPLPPGPGLFVGVDLPKALAFARDLTAAEDPQRAQLEFLAEQLSGATGSAAMALRFDSGGATFDVAVPLKALGATQPPPLPAGSAPGQGT